MFQSIEVGCAQCRAVMAYSADENHNHVFVCQKCAFFAAMNRDMKKVLKKHIRI